MSHKPELLQGTYGDVDIGSVFVEDSDVEQQDSKTYDWVGEHKGFE